MSDTLCHPVCLDCGRAVGYQYYTVDSRVYCTACWERLYPPDTLPGATQAQRIAELERTIVAIQNNAGTGNALLIQERLQAEAERDALKKDVERLCDAIDTLVYASGNCGQAGYMGDDDPDPWDNAKQIADKCRALRSQEAPDASTYPCAVCGAPRTEAEGGKIFTVCDKCVGKRILEAPDA